MLTLALKKKTWTLIKGGELSPIGRKIKDSYRKGTKTLIRGT